MCWPRLQAAMQQPLTCAGPPEVLRRVFVFPAQSASAMATTVRFISRAAILLALSGSASADPAPAEVADLVLLDWHAIEGIWAAPTANPLDLLLRRANRTHVQHVLVAGRWVVRDGRTTTLDETTLKNHLHDLLATQPPPKNTARLQAEIAHLAPAIRHFYSTWDRENDVNSDLR